MPPRFVPTALVVIATTEKVATWAAKPISSFQPGSCFAPWVLGPKQVPRITDIEQARDQVELAVLSAMLHGADRGEDSVRIVQVALEVVSELDEQRVLLYNDLMLAALGKLAQHLLEALMERTQHTYLSDFARKYYGQGKAEGKAEDIMTVLRTRGLEISDEIREKLLALQDQALLETLLERSVSIERIDDLFAGVTLPAQGSI
jgi:hypothetical protein